MKSPFFRLETSNRTGKIPAVRELAITPPNPSTPAKDAVPVKKSASESRKTKITGLAQRKKRPLSLKITPRDQRAKAEAERWRETRLSFGLGARLALEAP